MLWCLNVSNQTLWQMKTILWYCNIILEKTKIVYFSLFICANKQTPENMNDGAVKFQLLLTKLWGK